MFTLSCCSSHYLTISGEFFGPSRKVLSSDPIRCRGATEAMLGTRLFGSFDFSASLRKGLKLNKRDNVGTSVEFNTTFWRNLI